MNHQILSRQTVYSGHAFNVETLHVCLPDKRVRDYDLVNHNDSVTIIPIDENGFIWFVRQFRMGSDKKLLELPAGVMDDHETRENCAFREIREEIGMAAGKILHIGSIYLAPGYSNEINHVFLALNITHSPLESDVDEFLDIETHHINKISALIKNGVLIDAKSIAALYLMQQNNSQ